MLPHLIPDRTGGMKAPPLGYALRPGLGEVEVYEEGSRASLRATRLSPIDMSCIATKSGSFDPGDALRFRLLAPGEDLGPIGGVITTSLALPFGDLSEVAVSFGNVPCEMGRAILALLRQRAPSGGLLPSEQHSVTLETFTEPERIDSVLRALSVDGALARMRQIGPWGEPVASARIINWDPTARLGLRLACPGPWPDPPFEIEATGYNSVFRFRVDEISRVTGLLAAAAPRSMVRLRQRGARRVPAPEGTWMSFRHPLWPEISLRRRVREVSLFGLSLETEGLEDALFPGLRLPMLELWWGGDRRVRLRGIVCHVSPEPGIDGELAGIHLESVSPQDERAWSNMVATQLHPRTKEGSPDGEALWRLYSDSGYFNLSGKSEESFESTKRTLGNFIRRIADHPSVGCQVLWPSNRGIESSVTMIRPYAHTWIGYQLARRPGEHTGVPGRLMLRDVLQHGYEHPLSDPAFRWFVTWVQVEGRFSRLLMHSFTKRYLHDPRRAALVRFRVLEADTDGAAGNEDTAFTVGPATEGELARLFDRIAAARPMPYIEAHDLVPERFELSEVREDWRRAGLERERAILVARRHGTAGAAAVVESVEPGLHLYGLFDVVRIFPLAFDGSAATAPLLEAARSWYRARGRRTFAWFCESMDFAPALEAGFRDLGEADMTIISGDLLPDQLEHLWEITAPRKVNDK